MSLKSISKSVQPLTSPVFQRKYVKLGRILSSWEQIAGAEFANIAYPIALKPRKQREKITFILHMATESAQSQRLSYQKELILSRLEHFFGERIITDITIHHASKQQPKPFMLQKNLTETEKTYLSDMVSRVDDATLRERLEAFSKTLFLSEKNKRT